MKLLVEISLFMEQRETALGMAEWNRQTVIL